MEWRVSFVGTVEENGTLSSLHGAEEVEEEQTWLAVKALYPRQWAEFLRRAAHSRMPAVDIIAHMELDSVALAQWAQRNGQRNLRTHYARATRLGVEASPTLLVRNTPFHHRITAERLAWEACKETDNAYCDSLPECMEDADCRREGKIGECDDREDDPVCVFHDAVKFAFIIVSRREEPGSAEREAMATTRELFPGVEIERVAYSSPRGRRLLSEVNPPALPLYLFEKRVASSRNFTKIESGVVGKGEYYTFRPGIMRPTFYYRRPLEGGDCRVFLDPHSPRARETLRRVLQSEAPLTPIIYQDPREPPANAEERLRREEAQRWVLLAQEYPRAFRGYLEVYAAQTAGSYWFRALRKLGVDVNEFVQKVENDSTSLARLWDRLSRLHIREDLAVLRNNRELLVGAEARKWAKNED
jgi:hypothetical protein